MLSVSPLSVGSDVTVKAGGVVMLECSRTGACANASEIRWSLGESELDQMNSVDYQFDHPMLIVVDVKKETIRVQHIQTVGCT